MPLPDHIQYSLLLRLPVSCISLNSVFSSCCRDAHTYTLSKKTQSKSLKIKNMDCIILDKVLNLARGEIHKRIGKGTMVEPQWTLKSCPAELQPWRKIPAGETLNLYFLQEIIQSWPSLFNISLSLWQINNL